MGMNNEKWDWGSTSGGSGGSGGYVYSDTIGWDGDTTGKQIINVTDTVQFVRITDFPFPEFEFEGLSGFVGVNFEGVLTPFPFEGSEITADENGVFNIGDYVRICPSGENAGVWFVKVNERETGELYTLFFTLNMGGLKIFKAPVLYK